MGWRLGPLELDKLHAGEPLAASGGPPRPHARSLAGGDSLPNGLRAAPALGGVGAL